MKTEANTIDQYMAQIADDKKDAFIKLRQVLKDNLPSEFSEELSYGMIGYVIPHALYPKGYHCNPKLPLPFINLAAQKNFIALYHMGIYADKTLFDWFTNEYPKHVKTKLDMGKSCIRFKKPENIPYDLIGELALKMQAKDWINLYENTFQKK